jgi:hypothetical protein
LIVATVVATGFGDDAHDTSPRDGQCKQDPFEADAQLLALEERLTSAKLEFRRANEVKVFFILKAEEQAKAQA